MITFAPATWVAILAQPDSATRAQVLVDFDVQTIEFLDAADALIRAITVNGWTVGVTANGKTPIAPSSYTDAALGSGTPVAAVFKDSGGTEVFRCSCGTGAGNFYRLLANLVEGVPIIPGDFAVVVLDPAQPGTFEPVATTPPSIAGDATVGAVLTATAGVWTGNPIPTVTRQWLRSGAAISGATGSLYVTTQADLGASITLRETAANSVGSKSATSNAIGPIQSDALRFVGVPDPIEIAPGGSYDLEPHVSGGVPPYSGYAVDAGTLPAGVTLSGSVLNAAAGTAPITTGDITFGVDDSVADPGTPGALPQFGLLSAVGGSNLPFTFGHVFRKGDVPAGKYIASDLTDWQAIPTAYWPDGSVRHAIISGRATLTAGIERKLTLSVSDNPPAGAALTVADISAGMWVEAGGVTVSLANVRQTSAPHRIVCAGPTMVNAIWRAPVTGHPTLVVWFDVRYYKGGLSEIFPWVENVAPVTVNGANDVRTWRVLFGSDAVFDLQIDIKHRSRAPLIYNVGSSFKHWSYWYGGVPGFDPQITPHHDPVYLQATKMVPNYGWAPTASQLNLSDANQSFQPALVTDVSYAMGSASHMNYVGPLSPWDAAWAASGDARAFNKVMQKGLEFGAYSMHYRDATDNEAIKYFDYRTVTRSFESAPTGGAYTHPTNGTTLAADIAHQPSIAYAAWLASGRWFFLDEMVFWVCGSFLDINYQQRGYEDGMFARWIQTRAVGRLFRNLGHTLACIPSDFPNRAQYINQMEKSIGFNHDRHADPASPMYSPIGALFVGSLDVTSPYSPQRESTKWWDAHWMINQSTQNIAMIHDLDLPISSAANTKLGAMVNHGLKFAVGQFGPDGADQTGKDYRIFDYCYPIAYDSSGLPPEGWMTWPEIEAFMPTPWRVVNRPGNTTPVVATGTKLLYVDWGLNSVKEVESGDWANTSAVCYQYTALTHAVERGIAGAEAAWARLTTSSTWTSGRGPYHSKFGLWPRNKAKP